MASKSTKIAAKPLAQLEELLPKVTHEELLRLTVGAIAEVGRRADAYADAVDEIDDPPLDVINEALAFVVRAKDVIPVLSENKQVSDAWHLMHDAQKDLKAALNAS